LDNLIIALRVFFEFAILYFMPIFLFMDKLELELAEKVIFSIFISIGIVPLIVFYVSLILISFKLSIFTTFIIMMISAIIFRIYKRKVKTDGNNTRI